MNWVLNLVLKDLSIEIMNIIGKLYFKIFYEYPDAMPNQWPQIVTGLKEKLLTPGHRKIVKGELRNPGPITNILIKKISQSSSIYLLSISKG